MISSRFSKFLARMSLGTPEASASNNTLCFMPLGCTPNDAGAAIAMGTSLGWTKRRAGSLSLMQAQEE